ncbi:MAG: hypothetical protein ACTS73_04320 [Arsenophonus sp. NEOnobi-MAG3]
MRNLNDMRYLYFLVDGIQSLIKQDDRLYLLVLSASLSMDIRS